MAPNSLLNGATLSLGWLQIAYPFKDFGFSLRVTLEQKWAQDPKSA